MADEQKPAMGSPCNVAPVPVFSNRYQFNANQAGFLISFGTVMPDNRLEWTSSMWMELHHMREFVAKLSGAIQQIDEMANVPLEQQVAPGSMLQ